MTTKRSGICLKCGNLNRNLDAHHFCVDGCPQPSKAKKPKKPKKPEGTIYTTRKQLREHAQILLEYKLNQVRTALAVRVKDIAASEIKARLWGDDAVSTLIDDTIREFDE
jgi:hypothetical protein